MSAMVLKIQMVIHTVHPGLGNPGPLGLGSFAMTTFVLSCFNAGVFIDARLEPVVLPLALFYGGIAQFAAGMWEYQTRYAGIVPSLRPDMHRSLTLLSIFCIVATHSVPLPSHLTDAFG